MFEERDRRQRRGVFCAIGRLFNTLSVANAALYSAVGCVGHRPTVLLTTKRQACPRCIEVVFTHGGAPPHGVRTLPNPSDILVDPTQLAKLGTG